MLLRFQPKEKHKGSEKFEKLSKIFDKPFKKIERFIYLSYFARNFK